jgi:hypothetical protein
MKHRNRFMLFNGIATNLADTLWSWPAIVSLWPREENVAILGNWFNGNASATQSFTNYASDGLVWLANGGKFIVDNCNLTNYHYEAVQFDAGPYTVVNNNFTTLSTCGSAVALFTDQTTDDQALSTAASIYSAYCFHNNTVKGGAIGVASPYATATNYPSGPYNLIISANQFDIPPTPSVGVPACISLEYANNVSVTGNLVPTNNYPRGGRAIQCINYKNHYLTNGAASYGTNFTLLVQGNDFANIDHASLLIHDTVTNKFTKAQLLYNKLGYAWDYGHIYMAIPYPTNNTPTLTVKGNQFWNGTTITNCSFYPAVAGWTAFPTNANLGWNQTPTNQFLINNPTEYADTNLFNLRF